MEIFNNELIQRQLLKLRESPPKYYIGICSGLGLSSYVLVRKYRNDTEALLTKTIIDKDEFLGEVENLSKYFNATKIGKT